MKRLTALLAFVACFAVQAPAAAIELYAWETEVEHLYTIDPAGPTATFIGGGDPFRLAEIEYVDPFIYGSSDGNLLMKIDPSTGLVISFMTLTSPPFSAITSLEYVGSTLYGGLFLRRSNETHLVTIDIDTGVVTIIGATGVGSPLGGLAWDGTTMYAVSAGGSTPRLFTVDLTTGATTLVGNVTVVGAPSIQLTALEFGSDGVLYSVPAVYGPGGLNGHLLSIDPVTAEATDLGYTGVPNLVALTSDFMGAIAVDIDIKFCSDPNALNCKKHGVLPVTIFGTEDFLVEDIDISTLQLCTADLLFCTGAPWDYSYSDRGDPLLDLGAAMCAIDPETGEELDWTDNQDDYLDLDAAFLASEVKAILGDYCADAAKGDVSEALVIMGETYDGVPIYSVPQDDNTGIDRLVKVNN